MSKKRDVLHDLSFGNQIAEEEKDTLKDYFVQTSSWQKILRGEIDVIYGPKGAGKSAIYVLIQDYVDYLFDKNVLLVSAEHIRGDPAFKSLTLDPPTSEREFTNIWKLYFLTLIARALDDYGMKGASIEQLRTVLSENGLLASKSTTLGAILKLVQTYVRKYSNPSAVEGGVQVSAEGMPKFSGKLTFEDTTPENEKKGFVSIDQLFNLANQSLDGARHKVWVLLDRLDVAFDESSELEKNALRALFRAYRDIRKYDHVVVKVFLRTDIWERIADRGFREATHISRDITLKWDKNSLQNLIVRRLLSNPKVLDFYSVKQEQVLEDYNAQSDFFYRVFPDQIELGEKQSNTMDWIIKRSTDSRNDPAPREIIYFLNKAVEHQMARLERGEEEPDGNALFDRAVFKEALPELSEYRTTKMLYAEYPDEKKYIEKMRGEKSEQSVVTLSSLWAVNEDETKRIAQKLVDIGFFEQRGSRENLSFWVPFMYRPYLGLVQGKAETDQ
ncbi:P-loop ATPase, Sll1717 family [Bradyrhizobium roseum]|uniref:P-loop ATPase, Sll1717 family n=1 Tax=Bradyrhizobium roseum TaxID=3056648 RepID=UPI0026047269|nr:hypothetical protein [Bradyrhizobium roseus]WKA29760.1 hypothetical protein QUH67_06155 [Bradyrhizobium roseus]